MELNNEDEDLTPRKRLGRRIKRLREQRGLSQRGLCEQLSNPPLPHSYLGRVERGEQLPSEDLIHKLDAFFEADGVLIEFWEMANKEVIPDYSRKVVSKEAEAERIQVFNSSMVTALLQTEDYMRSIFHRHLPDESEEQRTERAIARLRRQRIFDRPEPPYYWAIMDESALKRIVGERLVMLQQIDHLLHMARKPRIMIQIIPFQNGAYPMQAGSLTLHALQNGLTIGGVESFDSGEIVESPKRLAELAHRFEVACSLALSGEASVHLIEEYRREYENDLDS